MKQHFISISLLYFFLALFVLPSHSQVTIGSNLPANKGSLLDLKEDDNVGVNAKRGLLSARVELKAVDLLDPCVPSANSTDKEKHVGLLVYNLTDSLDIGLCPGLHVWDGAQWIRLPEPCAKPIIPIDPSLLNSPNCYIVKPGTVSEEIPIAKAYLVSEQRSDLPDLDKTAPVSISLLWQDKQSLISNIELVGGDQGAYSKIKVTASNNTGNAVVAVRVGGNIIWSWHIWVTDYDPDAKVNGTTYPHNNGYASYEFMDRNLGALNTSATDDSSMGLMYQWGRKDPFVSAPNFFNGEAPKAIYSQNNTQLTEGPSGTGIKYEQTSVANNLANSISNPTSFYYGPLSSTGAPFDWMTSDESGASGDNNLWGAVDGTKSPFDPCPKGWKMPAYSTAGKSPWVLYEAVDDGWGWGDATVPSEVVFGDTGFTLQNKSGAGELGFYPYARFRRDRSYEEPCGPVGSGSEISVPGGEFYYQCMGNAAARFVYYWTANAGDSSLSGKAEYMQKQADSMAPGSTNFNNQSRGKAMGAQVRCVKE
ncbi:hypothetical protein JGH11_01730 [Dysgonomonas sp. Marseille-P4677]|uniref:hypothetical protein n=1 Tax=Dysgonomonas sp. Marseille-P4677 TaxID=2364790 RepID=UPI00191348BF|nr:hypothetical protein [Dysgonomonas sp. Marseille-P4677]MBK5719583.1 hypothetical protein [Dysgonomonas sp. Marseille-P4677]